MSILIRGMEMPKKGHILSIVIQDGKVIGSNSRKVLSKEVIEVPKHGRLIDADALKGVCKEQWNDEYNKTHIPRNWARAFECFDLYVDDAPTIIEAEGEE